MNYSGFDNEDRIIRALNNTEFRELNNNLQKLIESSFSNYSGIIKCTKQAGQNKSDLKITMGSESHTYSIKKGTGNSIHQEPIEDFLEFLNIYKINSQIKNSIRFFIWGDGSLNGSGKVQNRLSATQLKRQYPEKLLEIQTFFDSIKKSLIERFVITGAKSIISADYIYYGTIEEGVCCNSEKAVDWILNNPSNGAINIGRLTFQAWNRNIKGDDKSEKKRGSIQLKWGTVKDDIKLISYE